MSRSAVDDPRLAAILEACYTAVCSGSEPDLDQLCASTPELREPVERMLRRERDLLARCGSSDRAEVVPIGAMLPPMPARLGPFEVLEAIGVGGMSHVFRARQHPLGREVALKVLRPEMVASATGRLRFEREATITAALDHPHIVPVYAAGEEQGHVFLAMRLLRGQSLDRAKTPMTPAQVARIGAEAASALQAAHEIGVVHRDVKPANLLLEGDHTYVVDFGLAAFAHQIGFLTQPQATPGTLVYMAPELVRRRGMGLLDVRTDVYSLGASLYEVLAGRPPFDAGNPVRALQQILHHDPPALGLRGADQDLETIVLRAMDKSPQRRFQSAGEMAAELARYRAGLPIHSRRRGPWRVAARFLFRHRTVSALVLLVLALVGVLGGTLVAERRARAAQIEHDLEASHVAIAHGDLEAARTGLAQLRTRGAAASLVDPLAMQVLAEQQLQLLEAMLQSPITHHDPQVIAALTDQLLALSDRCPDPMRADVVLAVATRLLHPNPLLHRPLSASAYRSWPRTAAVMPAWTIGADPEVALRAVGAASGGVLDHLYAALVLRLAHVHEAAVEAELRRGEPTVPHAAAIRHALAVSLEGQGDYRGAYDLLADLVEHPTYACPANAGCARLAARLGRRQQAEHHLERALHTADRDPALRSLSLPSELQVRCELGQREAFWEQWHAARATAGHLPHYWLRGGYAAQRLDDDAGAATRARDCFLQGLRCNPDPARRAALEIALLQIDWLQSPALASLDPLPDTEEFRAERQRLAELAQRAEQLAIATANAPVGKTVAGDALLVAAQAHRAIGNLATAWNLLERTCATYGAPEALSQLAFQVGYRIAQTQLNGPGFVDGDAEAAGPLEPMARLGLAYARRVEAIATTDGTVEASIREQARTAAFLCALEVGDATVALPFALARRGDEDCDEWLHELMSICIDWGGVRLDRLEVTASRRNAMLVEATAVLGRALDQDLLDAATVRDVLTRWREHASLQDAATDPAFCRFQERVAALEVAIQARGTGSTTGR